MEPASMNAIGTAGSGLLQGILALEAKKRRLAWDKQKWADEKEQTRFAQELAARQQLAAQPGVEAQRSTQTLQSLISNLGRTIR